MVVLDILWGKHEAVRPVYRNCRARGHGGHAERGLSQRAPGRWPSDDTTLDACGYFTGSQTVKRETVKNDVTTDRGNFTGVTNTFPGTPVASLGPVKGSFVETTTIDSDGNTVGTESFTSSSGKIEQTFTFGPTVIGGFSVSVTATGDLAFLTSDTDGNCYTGAYPRP